MATDRNTQVRVGIVGIGFGQQVLVQAFQADNRCYVAAIGASHLDRAQHVAQRFGIPQAYGNWQTLVANPGLDVIAIATPPWLHPEIVLAALARGKHVFCEKPLATTPTAAATMLEAARTAGLTHMIDFEFSTIEAWQEARRLLQNGAVGRVRHAIVSWQVETMANRLNRRSWKTTAKQGGGTLNLFVSHTFYYVEWLLGPIQRLSARLFSTGLRDDSPAADTLVVLCAELQGGAPVAVSVCSNAFLGSGHRVEIYGDDGTLTLNNPSSDYVNGFQLLRGSRAGASLDVVPLTLHPSLGTDGRVGPVSRLVTRFLSAIRGDGSSDPTFEEGYRVQCLLDAARQAHEAGTWVDVASSRATDEAKGAPVPPSLGVRR